MCGLFSLHERWKNNHIQGKMAWLIFPTWILWELDRLSHGSWKEHFQGGPKPSDKYRWNNSTYFEVK